MKLGIKFESEWKPLFRPKRCSSYVNDHTIYKNAEGKHVLLGTTARWDYGPLKENFFVRAESSDLNKEFNKESVVFRTSPHIGPKIAPNVFYNKKDSTYHLFFAPGIVFHYISKDGMNWQKVDDAVRSLWFWLRDPHVIDIGNEYLMYLTDVNNKISVFKSLDLYKWKKLRTALILGEGIPKSFNSSCESPCVFEWRKWFILTTTITTSPVSRRQNYTRTVAFASKDPTNFGVYAKDHTDSANDIGYIDTHAPEVIQENGKLYITTCGWKGFPKPTGVGDEGVFIRKINLYEY